MGVGERESCISYSWKAGATRLRHGAALEPHSPAPLKAGEKFSYGSEVWGALFTTPELLLHSGSLAQSGGGVTALTAHVNWGYTWVNGESDP